MLEQLKQGEVVDYFKEVTKGDMAQLNLSVIYYSAQEQINKTEKVEDLARIAKVPFCEVVRIIFIDDNNVVFEVEDKNNRLYTCLVIDGMRSTKKYKTLEDGMLGWLCKKQGYMKVLRDLLKILDIKELKTKFNKRVHKHHLR